MDIRIICKCVKHMSPKLQLFH